MAKGAKALADFAKLLKDSITAVKSPNQAKSLPPIAGKRSVHRTMRAMAKTAAENHCDIRLKHTEADGETLEVEITARQAVEVQQVLDPPRAVQEHAALAGPLPAAQLPAVSEAIGRLYGPGAQAYSASEAQTIADSLFDVLESAGLIEIIPQLITDLRLKGSFTLAEALETKLNERRGKHGPSLTTT
ncbi:hypothetical protein AAE026_08120 [Bradyrhizobium sp. DN5]|uniref:hypothetical protein n=1 Tax=Bradyrhizobium sp. DN5 TaxID=3056950 RepID=UPI003525BD3F